jgi:2-polyprenyl-3-methyl-5-hydroxy-6-metoxy-1,4-benzoquinol methylase
MGSTFDAAGPFNDDYLWFYEPVLIAERNRYEASEIAAALGLARGAAVLDAPRGHGRISNLLATDGYRVTGVDLTEVFIERARADAENSPSMSSTAAATCDSSLYQDRSTR